MVAAAPLKTMKKVKKRTKAFKRFQSNRFMRVKESWRRPRGIDCRVRRRFRGAIKMANIGYGNNKKTRHVLPCGLKKFRVSNTAELEMLIMQNRKFAAEICHNVSARKRKMIVDRAAELRITVLNANGRLRAEEAE
eukprot:GSMAST32.ASY1.ANO1.1222.1 assembled CDS